MAKLQRKSAKLFAENANTGIGGVAQFGSLAAGDPNYSKDPDIIQALDAFKNGWSDAVTGNKSPAIEDRNALDYLLSYQQAYIMQHGIPEWLSTESYYQGSFASIGENLYVSRTDNNTGNDPSTDITETNWAKFPTPTDLVNKADIDLSNVNATGKSNAVSWNLPDLSAGVSVSTGSFTPTTDGLLIGVANDTNGNIKVQYDNLVLAWSVTGGSFSDRNSFCIPVEKSYTYTITLSNGTLTFYPYKGAN